MQFQKKEKRQTTVRFDSHHVRLRTGEVQRKTGSYMYRWTDKLGKRNTIYAATLEDLREQEEQILVDQHDGIKANIKNVTVNDVYELWCQLKRGIKDSTMKNYIYMYELFVKPTFGKKKLVQVKKSDVRRFYNQLIDDKVLKPSTVDVIHNIVHQVFQIAVDDDMIRSNPAANMLREIKMAHGSEIEKRKALTLEQEELFLGYLARTPKYQHWYVISDVHGYYTQMKSALEKAGFFSDTTPHKLIMLGDLFDRGHEAKQLQQFILEQMEQDKIILIRGNHEDLFVELVTTDAGMPYSYHKSNGTYDTALQLTGFDPVMASIRHYDFADAAKDTPFYKEIIQAMLDYFETEHYVFTHGWIPSIPNRDKSYSYISSWREADREQWNQARWFNGMDAAQTADENKTIVCGHWHTSYGHSKYEHKGTEFGEDADFSPYYGPGIIAIDACTAFSGKVNCLVMED